MGEGDSEEVREEVVAVDGARGSLVLEVEERGRLVEECGLRAVRDRGGGRVRVLRAGRRVRRVFRGWEGSGGGVEVVGRDVEGGNMFVSIRPERDGGQRAK